MWYLPPNVLEKMQRNVGVNMQPVRSSTAVRMQKCGRAPTLASKGQRPELPEAPPTQPRLPRPSPGPLQTSAPGPAAGGNAQL